MNWREDAAFDDPFDLVNRLLATIAARDEEIERLRKIEADGWLVVHRSDYGYADSLDTPDGKVLLHLREGTKINERNVLGFVSRVAATARALAQRDERIAELEKERDEAHKKSEIDEAQCDEMTEAAGGLAQQIRALEAENERLRAHILNWRRMWCDSGQTKLLEEAEEVLLGNHGKDPDATEQETGTDDDTNHADS